MSSNYNSITSYNPTDLKQLQDAAGITQFPSETSWFQIINGLQIQGGFVNAGSGATVAVAFSAPYEKQLLGIFIQVIGAAENGAYVGAPTLTGFNLVSGVGARDYYWWAIGV